MKSPQQVLLDVERRVERTWADVVGGAPGLWPHKFRIGQPTGAELAAGFSAAAEQVAIWRGWAREHHATLSWRPRRVMGTSQELPTHLVVPDLDTAVALCGGVWPERVSTARLRAQVLTDRYPHIGAQGRFLRSTHALTDVDFDLLCTAADWFATNDATGLTPRQVPVPGLHAKWLNTRQQLVAELAGLDHLGLVRRHPSRLHLTYLDPDYRAGGGRHHDSATVGDRVLLPYVPRVVVISENKDTALMFPPVPGAVSVEGVGKGGGTAASFEWLTMAAHVIYWGDMDAVGLEILNEFRAVGVPAVSILMDVPAYQTWQRFGTDVDVRGRPLRGGDVRTTPYLTDGERQLYNLLTAPMCVGPRRVEQERIPLEVARAAVHTVTG